MLEAINHDRPTVDVSAEISGRHPGDERVRFLASVLLSNFKGYAFDEYLAYSHAWTLDEIELGVLVDEHPFFDYLGWRNDQRRNEQSERERKEQAEKREQRLKPFRNSWDDDTLREMVRQGLRIEAIIRLRQQHGWGLKEANDYISSLH